jgi:uncharacterized membrane protein YphA (DoxX/SURF4 family)
MEEKPIKSNAKTKISNVVYWITTVAIGWELIFGGLWDINVLNKGYVQNIMDHLGYPSYFPFIFGIAKFIAAIVILAPGLLRLKEWAYAGIIFVFTGAAFSHLFVHKADKAIFDLVFASIPLVSWALRPASRRLTHDELVASLSPESIRNEKHINQKRIAYWICVSILGLGAISGGLSNFFHASNTQEIVKQLGYPIYFFTILGAWKVLGSITIFFPRFPRLQEWAYAGLMIDLVGASTSYICVDKISGMFTPLISGIIGIVAWKLRPFAKSNQLAKQVKTETAFTSQYLS